MKQKLSSSLLINTIILFIIGEIGYCVIMSLLFGIYCIFSPEVRDNILYTMAFLHFDEDKIMQLSKFSTSDFNNKLRYFTYAFGYYVQIIFRIGFIILLIYKPTKIVIKEKIKIEYILFTLLLCSAFIICEDFVFIIDNPVIDKIQEFHLIPNYRWIDIYKDNSILLSILKKCLLAPIAEELLFRYRINNALKPLGEHIAIIVTSILFASVHTEIPNTFNIFIIGIFLGYILLYTENIIYPIIFHIIVNSEVIIAEYLDISIFESMIYCTYVIAATLICMFIYIFIEILLKGSYMGIKIPRYRSRAE